MPNDVKLESQFYNRIISVEITYYLLILIYPIEKVILILGYDLYAFNITLFVFEHIFQVNDMEKFLVCMKNAQKGNT